MGRALEAGQWAALRLLRENETPVTYDLLAQAAGGGLTAEECRAALEKAREGEGHGQLSWMQLRAMRQAFDDGDATLRCVGAVAGIDHSTLNNRALSEGWKKPNIKHWRQRGREELALDVGVAEAVRLEKAAPTAPPAAPEIGRAARVSAMLVKHADLLLGKVEAQGGVLTKPQLDAMLAMVRLAEKFEPLAAKEEAELQQKSDDEVAEIYDRVQKRIEARARYLARQMVAEKNCAPRDRAGGRKLAADGA